MAPENKDAQQNGSKLQRRWTRARPCVDQSNGEPPPTSYDPPSWAPECKPREIFGPVHDFLRGKRKAQWYEGPDLPPLFYNDRTTILREVSVRQLRRGDHCVLAVHPSRTVHPLLDQFTSLLTALEVWRIYHHFLLLDDVASIDANGVPRTKDGGLVSLLEATNTAAEMIEMIRMMSGGKVQYYLPKFCWCMTYAKAEPHRTALADYGDMPYICRIEESLNDSERDRIVRDAERMLVDARTPGNLPIYGFVNANCEHFVNRVGSKRSHSSPELWFVFVWLGLLVSRSIGTYMLPGLCLREGCNEHYPWLVWNLLTACPTCLVLFIELVSAIKAASAGLAAHIITMGACVFLLAKELFRIALCGVFTLSVFARVFEAAARGDQNIVYLGTSRSLPFATLTVHMLTDMAFCMTVQICVRVYVRLTARTTKND